MDAVKKITIKLDKQAQKARADWIRETVVIGSTHDGIRYWARYDKARRGHYVIGAFGEPGRFEITPAFAARAWDLMAAEYGVRWYEKADASKHDEAIQLAAFGKRVFA
jgi:hypothetical protein